ncbi:MAG: rod shape-determining protein MreD [Lachnospiraceae bacterium]|nr:rod shape-determining protein MreD [Lachnospiraceae bacterium]
MKRLLIIILVVISFLLQSTLFQYISFAGIVPNLMIIVVSASGYMRGKTDGAIAGFLGGLLIDIFYGDIIGFNALLFLYIGYVNGFANRYFYPDDIKLPLLFVSVSDFVYLLVTYIVRFLLRARFDIGNYFVNVMLPELVYTFIIAVLIFAPISFISLRYGRFEKDGE